MCPTFRIVFFFVAKIDEIQSTEMKAREVTKVLTGALGTGIQPQLPGSGERQSPASGAR